MNLFPNIDLNAIAPVAGLAAIAAICIVALLFRSLLHLLRGLLNSRIALVIAIVAGVAISGPTLAAALSGIIWALIPLALVLAGIIVAVLVLLSRNPELIDLARDLIPHKAEPPAQPPLELQAPPSTAS